ncbi:MAG: hypothetical protein NXY57DRAFT_1042944 [Lentinula lateritia]|nr:MAG: hypothetical protein NXY57DRAFT_1042944 [Lentinula lateritia]
MKFIVSISTFLLVTLLAITVDAIALDDKLACGAPWNIGHSEGSSCKFWGKDGNGTHVHDGNTNASRPQSILRRFTYKCGSVQASRNPGVSESSLVQWCRSNALQCLSIARHKGPQAQEPAVLHDSDRGNHQQLDRSWVSGLLELARQSQPVQSQPNNQYLLQ